MARFPHGLVAGPLTGLEGETMRYRYALLFVVALLAGCGMATVAPGDVEELVDDDCDGDADSDVEDAPRSWPVDWSAILTDGSEDHDLAEFGSSVSIWSDGFAVFDLLAIDIILATTVELTIELPGGIAPGEYETNDFAASIFVSAQDGTTICDTDTAIGIVTITGGSPDDAALFSLEFSGDGCLVRLSGRITAPLL